MHLTKHLTSIVPKHGIGFYLREDLAHNLNRKTVWGRSNDIAKMVPSLCKLRKHRSPAFPLPPPLLREVCRVLSPSCTQSLHFSRRLQSANPQEWKQRLHNHRHWGLLQSTDHDPVYISLTGYFLILVVAEFTDKGVCITAFPFLPSTVVLTDTGLNFFIVEKLVSTMIKRKKWRREII